MKAGVFSGPVDTRWLDDGRSMEVLNILTFTDSTGKVWTAPAGAVVDGASIPRLLWWFIGSPFCGRYRRASVIHDVYCKTMSEPWQSVHNVFNEMMAADFVVFFKRFLMFRAVWFGGPRW